MKLSGKRALAYCGKPDPAIWATLLFGDDEGVVADAAARFADASYTDANVETVRIDDDALRKDPATLIDALEARSLLGEERIIHMRTVGDKSAAKLLEILKLGDETPGRFAGRLLVTTGPLKSRSKLRTAFEASASAAALLLFSDDLADIETRVRDVLNRDGTEIGPDALAAFIQELSGHRALAHQEIAKLALYGRGLGRPIGLEDIGMIGAAETDRALHDLADQALAGDAAAAARTLDRLFTAGAQPIGVLRALQRETERLLAAHSAGGQGGDIGMKLKPPVFKTAWPAFRARMDRWPPKHLARLLERIYDAERAAKTAGVLGAPMVRALVNDVSRIAASR